MCLQVYLGRLLTRIQPASTVRSQYAHDLLEIARGMGSRWVASHVGPAMARRSQISVRLLDVLDPHRQRGGAGRAVAAAAALVCLSAALPLAALAPRTDGDTIQ